LLTKAIIQEQYHVGLACQTSEAQARAEGLYTLRELRVRYLEERVPELVTTDSNRIIKSVPWRTTMNEAHPIRA
jgi:hypothetical protein